MVFDDLKKANIEAMKAHDQNARGVYSVLINKCMLKSVELKAKNQELTDADTLSLINKTIKELDEEYETYKKASRDEQAAVIAYQKSLLEKYLPKLMSEEEIEAEITKLEDKSLKNVMVYFKTNFAGKCDMKLVSAIAKKFN
jgi:yqeY family protein